MLPKLGLDRQVPIGLLLVIGTQLEFQGLEMMLLYLLHQQGEGGLQLVPELV